MALRLHLSAPNAHFRIMQSNNPRKTYPIPPYSTVMGVLANILGEKAEILFQHKFTLGVLSQYEYVNDDYIWLRNMSPAKHKKVFATETNRIRHEYPEHPGGQSPATIQTLNDVNVWIYLHHTDPQVEVVLKENLWLPEKWYSHLHLGRAEDWAIPESLSFVELKKRDNPSSFKDSKNYYQWMPSPDSENFCQPFSEEYKELFDKVSGNTVLVTAIYKKVNINNSIIRNFSHVPAKMTKSQVPWLSPKRYPKLYCDIELNVPVYLVNIDPSKE